MHRQRTFVRVVAVLVLLVAFFPEALGDVVAEGVVAWLVGKTGVGAEHDGFGAGEAVRSSRVGAGVRGRPARPESGGVEPRSRRARVLAATVRMAVLLGGFALEVLKEVVERVAFGVITAWLFGG